MCLFNFSRVSSAFKAACFTKSVAGGINLPPLTEAVLKLCVETYDTLTNEGAALCEFVGP